MEQNITAMMGKEKYGARGVWATFEKQESSVLYWFILSPVLN